MKRGIESIIPEEPYLSPTEIGSHAKGLILKLENGLLASPGASEAALNSFIDPSKFGRLDYTDGRRAIGISHARRHDGCYHYEVVTVETTGQDKIENIMVLSYEKDDYYSSKNRIFFGNSVNGRAIYVSGDTQSAIDHCGEFISTNFPPRTEQNVDFSI